MTNLVAIERTVKDHVPVNYWLVTFELVWGSECNSGIHTDCLTHGCMDNEPTKLVEVYGDVKRISKVNYYTLGAQGMTLDTNTRDCYDDTHDFRPRLFKTKKEALEHKTYTLNRWYNPSPWEVFIRSY